MAASWLQDMSPIDTGELWVERYAPRLCSDLVLHSRKVNEVREWMQRSQGQRGAVLQLQGPVGCGKSSLVQCLCRDLGYERIEWEVPADTEMHFRSIARLFADFIRDTVRSSSVISTARRILVLQEEAIPQHVSIYQRVLSLLVQLRASPVPVIIECSTAGRQDRRVFDLPFADRITMNPVNATALKKAARRIIKDTAGYDTALPQLIEACQGDLRSLIHRLQFQQIAPQESCGINTVDEADRDLSSFEMIGKLLYRKTRPSTVSPRDVGNASAVQRYVDTLYSNMDVFAYDNSLSDVANLMDAYSEADCLLQHTSRLETTFTATVHVHTLALHTVYATYFLLPVHLSRRWTPIQGSMPRRLAHDARLTRQRTASLFPTLCGPLHPSHALASTALLCSTLAYLVAILACKPSWDPLTVLEQRCLAILHDEKAAEAVSETESVSEEVEAWSSESE